MGVGGGGDVHHNKKNVSCLCLCNTVNNVGMTYSEHFAYFLEIPEAEQVSFAFYCKCHFLKTMNWMSVLRKVMFIYHSREVSFVCLF